MSKTNVHPLEKFCLELDLGAAVKTGSWFGMPCLKVGGRAFAAAFQEDMVFKLPAESWQYALQIAGARLFDPRGGGKPMQEWVLVPQEARVTWCQYARQACRHVANIAEEQKATLIAGLVEARQAILRTANLWTPAQREQVFLGTWDIKDLVAHLIGWDYTNLQAIQAIRRGERPDFWQYFDRDWAAYNGLLVSKYRQDDWEALLNAAKCSHQALISYLDSLLPDEYLRFPKIGTLLRAESKDEKVHARQVSDYEIGVT